MTCRKRAEIPIYSFAKHAREEKTTSIYSPHVLILEGIFALYDPRVLDLLDMKVSPHCFIAKISNWVTKINRIDFLRGRCRYVFISEKYVISVHQNLEFMNLCQWHRCLRRPTRNWTAQTRSVFGSKTERSPLEFSFFSFIFSQYSGLHRILTDWHFLQF